MVRAVGLVMALVLGACGGSQPQSTTVSSAGADVPGQEVVESESSSDFELPQESVDIEEYAMEPDDVVPEVATDLVDEPERRDTKMMSYEEAMALPIDVGDITSEGGEAQLSANQIASFMDAHLDEMYEECIRRELERGNLLGTVTVDLAIRGKDGMILGTTIEPGRRRFKKCLESYLEDLRFPTFASPRMGARYRFHTS